LRLSARPNPVVPMMADLRFAVRQLLKSSGLTFLAVITLARVIHS